MYPTVLKKFLMKIPILPNSSYKLVPVLSERLVDILKCYFRKKEKAMGRALRIVTILGISLFGLIRCKPEDNNSDSNVNKASSAGSDYLSRAIITVCEGPETNLGNKNGNLAKSNLPCRSVDFAHVQAIFERSNNSDPKFASTGWCVEGTLNGSVLPVIPLKSAEHVLYFMGDNKLGGFKNVMRPCNHL